MLLDFLLRKGENRSLRTSEEIERYLSRGLASSSGVDVTPTRAMQFGAVFACVRVLAESVGQLPVHLMRETGNQKTKAKDHPLFTLLHDAPNEFQTAQEWREWLVGCLCLRGNAYCQIIRLGGRVLELLPIHPDAVSIRRTAAGDLVYGVQQADGPVMLPASEMLHVKLFSVDGFMGASPVSYARDAIGLGIATEEHGAGLFARGAAPGGALQTDQILNEEVSERLRNSWEERHAGSTKSHRVAVLEAGLKWQAIGMSSLDAQWLESRKYQRSEIAGIYRVPPHLIGDLEHATFSNIEHQGLDFVVHALMPYLTRIEQRIALQLLTTEERKTYFAKFNVAGLLRGDMAARAQFYTQLVQNGALSPNEIRELEDMNPREGGDVYLTPSNMLIDGEAPPTAKPPAR
jgi:HK97 family phage portal protein